MSYGDEAKEQKSNLTGSLPRYFAVISPDISQTFRAESKRRAGADFRQALVGRLF